MYAKKLCKPCICSCPILVIVKGTIHVDMRKELPKGFFCQPDLASTLCISNEDIKLCQKPKNVYDHSRFTLVGNQGTTMP